MLDEAKRLTYSAPLSAAAHQLYLMGASKGWSKEADSGIVRIWESMTGISVASPLPTPTTFTPRQYPIIPLDETLASLPPVHADNTLSTIKSKIASPSTPTLIILDDDPTGTQTCDSIPVLTVWDTATLKSELQTSPAGFFILTNSRALPGPEAKDLIKEICTNISSAAVSTSAKFQIVLRGDSTLRGHFPEEPESVEECLGSADAWILAPFFLQGGRYTINDVHYVAEGNNMVPASQTPFAADATFGYASSNLRDYVLEKAGPKFSEKDIFSITLEDIRLGGPEKVTERLLSVPKGSVVVINAAAESDMHVFALGAIGAEQAGKSYLYRTGAAFVSSRLGIPSKPPMTAEELGIASEGHGGLIIAGSYVPKTTAQLAALRRMRGEKLAVVELDVAMLIDSSTRASVVADTIATASQNILSGKDVLVMTSRKLITGHDGISSLRIGSAVAAALVDVLEGIEVRPRYIIAKGGITSSDAATKGLRMKRAIVLGQAAPGVPIWRCGEEGSRHRSVVYVVFPGNVGGEETLGELVGRWGVGI